MKVGFIGTGNMAGAIIKGILAKGDMPAAEIAVMDTDPEKTAPYEGDGHPVFRDTPSLVESCDIIVLSIKPQVFTQVLPQVAAAMTPEKILVPIAAGITSKRVKKAMGFDCKVVLAMPNTPMLLGCGATALARVEPTTIKEFRQVEALFGAAGVTGQVAEANINASIPVSGSSPAFLYLFAKIITQTAENHGIDGQTAMDLFCQTMIGSARMLLESGKTPAELIKMVCTPGGTTLAGLRSLEDHGFDDAVEAAFEACVTRAEEMAGLSD